MKVQKTLSILKFVSYWTFYVAVVARLDQKKDFLNPAAEWIAHWFFLTNLVIGNKLVKHYFAPIILMVYLFIYHISMHEFKRWCLNLKNSKPYGLGV